MSSCFGFYQNPKRTGERDTDQLGVATGESVSEDEQSVALVGDCDRFGLAFPEVGGQCESAGSTSTLPSWCRYSNGDVLLTTSGICKVAREVRVTLLEGVDAKLTELREKRYARYAGEFRGRTR